MVTPQILRFPRSDDDQGFVLVRAQERDNLDIELLATEGEAPYQTIVKAKRTSTLRLKNAPCTPEEFEIVVLAILRGQSATKVQALKDLEVVATVETENSMTLTIRKRTEGITQRLGAITLAYDEDQEIEPFEWCGLSVQAKDLLKDDLSKLTSKFEDQQKTITKLTKQLEDLLKAKKEHENQLLEKAALLLNEKKLKIRDQQRLLSTAKVDDAKLAAVQATRRPSEEKSSVTSSKNKRKGPVPIDDDDSSDGFDKMDIDEPVAHDSEEDAMTPEPDEDETESEQEAPPSKVTGHTGGTATRASHKSTASATDNANQSKTAENSTGSSTVHKDDVIPPPRHLPFSMEKKSTAVRAPEPPIADADEETESDDEL